MIREWKRHCASVAVLCGFGLLALGSSQNARSAAGPGGGIPPAPPVIPGAPAPGVPFVPVTPTPPTAGRIPPVPGLPTSAPVPVQQAPALPAAPVADAGHLALDEAPLGHTVLDRSVDDSPLKTQVDLRVLATGRPVTASNLRNLLTVLYEQAMQQTGFRFREHPSAVYIWIYTTRDQDGSDWVGMLQKSHSDQQPNISVDENRLARIDTPVDPRCAARCSRWARLSRIEEETCARDRSVASPSRACLAAMDATMAASPGCVCP